MEKVLRYLRENEAKFIQTLCDYIRFPSVSAQPQHRKDLGRCAEWLVKHCRGLGLKTQLAQTKGNPVVIARTPRDPAKPKPHFLVYGHYDVQPGEPFELWKTGPFEPHIVGRSLFGRGSCDNKGQHMAHLNAVEAYLKTGTPLPCDLTFFIEGEEEVGSDSLPEFLKERQGELQCQGIIISDTGIPSLRQPALTYALRGVLALEIKVVGPNRDLHSGLFGGSVDNPAMVLCQLLARLRDKQGRVTIPGFYDDIVPLTKLERRELARLPFNEKSYRKFLGVPQLFGEQGYTPIEQKCARPTLEINGLTSGYQGEGSKTIVPSWASAKLTMRLVPNQTTAAVQKKVIQHLKKLCPQTVRLEITPGHGGEPYLVSPTSEKAQAALRALRKAFGCEPVLLREGGSIPIVNQFKKILGAESLMLGLSLPDDNPHSPNEKFNLDCYSRGMAMSAYLWPELAALRLSNAASGKR